MNIGRPRDTSSANYKLITQLFGNYVSQKDMTKPMLKMYKNSLKVFG